MRFSVNNLSKMTFVSKKNPVKENNLLTGMI